jgi:predicted PhzF superfamily epimerase YddE/YHI9
MGFDLTVVDAFTATPYSGNPAAVAKVTEFPDVEVMQRIAAEMNLSETAFVAERADGAWELRWFTPTLEVDLCGHATLATAHVLGGSATFHTKSGVLRCTRARDGWIEMDFPTDPPTSLPPPSEVVFDNLEWWGTGRALFVAELGSADDVRGYVPDLSALAALGAPVIVTAPGDRDGIDCVSRVFAPTLGIAEDPVTGAAHCALGPYWAPRVGRTELVGEQASRRGGTVRMRVLGDRVVLGGQAVTVATVRMG